jgi:hydroxyethylthiazole kinase-like uncharacterized protein yjeF
VPVDVDDALLRAWPLPAADAEGDKESRGRVLVVAGSREIAGAAMLAATAALRAGAGKLAVAAPASVAQTLVLALPEARVIPLPETQQGGPDPAGVELLRRGADDTAAVLVGPGMMDAKATTAFVARLLPLFPQATVVLDALAMDAVLGPARPARPPVLLPHAGEMAHLTGLAKEEILARPLDVAMAQARRWGAVVALKGATTCVAVPDGQAWRHEACVPGLGTSGSGDVLAGIVAGLAARGAPPEQAAVWGVALHARAGTLLAREHGELGYLAREIASQVPRLMERLGR